MKVNNYLLYVLVLIGLALGVWNLIQEKDKIVYVDTAKLFQEYSEAVKINMKLGQEAKKYEGNIDTLMQEIQIAIKDYEKNGLKLDPISKRKQELIINEKQADLQRYQAVVKEKLEKQRNEEFSGVVKTINSFLKDYGKQKGYRMILIANPAGTIAYAQESTDITEDIIKELNASK
ncbi:MULTISPECIES: OmpH family outer membrane protein [unclassified Sphingobacterium]|uniref:OmpH family outer membrane protein n=1 Tax=unclassified Sphingobacterium TaxID=2609468 RepID=UPI002954B12B|nr:OmpH family outer membrane protein [Sphingobacterium sp. UGAL515B_05]WON94264.1 OmpH family outer membrane protein [Sphingobacterium sp. UGAL515B_05]